LQVAQLQTGAVNVVPLEPHQLQAVATLPNIDTRLARMVTVIGLLLPRLVGSAAVCEAKRSLTKPWSM
jgi:hypothetical protein